MDQVADHLHQEHSYVVASACIAARHCSSATFDSEVRITVGLYSLSRSTTRSLVEGTTYAKSAKA
jgi:hypothetical protein